MVFLPKLVLPLMQKTKSTTQPVSESAAVVYFDSNQLESRSGSKTHDDSTSAMVVNLN